jgi:hypothetical protein
MSNAANNPISFNGIEIVERTFGPSAPASLPFSNLYLLTFYTLSIAANYQSFCYVSADPLDSLAMSTFNPEINGKRELRNQARL